MDMVDEFRAVLQVRRARSVLRRQHGRQAKAYLLNPGGRPKLDEFMATAVQSDYKGFLA